MWNRSFQNISVFVFFLTWQVLRLCPCLPPPSFPSQSHRQALEKMFRNPPFIICHLWLRNYDSRMIWCPKPAIAFTWLSSGPFDFTLNNLFQSSFVSTKMFVIYCFCGSSFYKKRKGLFFLTNLGNNWPLATFSSLMHFKIKCYLQELIRGSKSLPHGA